MTSLAFSLLDEVDLGGVVCSGRGGLATALALDGCTTEPLMIEAKEGFGDASTMLS